MVQRTILIEIIQGTQYTLPSSLAKPASIYYTNQTTITWRC